MPATDYTDPEIPFPRLQVRLQTLNKDTFHLTIWLWKAPGDERNRTRLMNQKWFGTFHDAHEYIKEFAKKHDADVGPDDISTE